VRSKGVFVWDDRGNRYLDGLSSLWNVNVGHGRTEIARAAAAQMKRLAFAPTLLGFSSEPAIEAGDARWRGWRPRA
jgi:putrescine---pyruvate transaminase